MSNPFSQFNTPSPASTGGNPFVQFQHADVADEQEQELISMVNNPKKPTPAYFGLTEVPGQFADGLASFFKGQIPIAAGATAIQAGEVLKEKVDKTAGKPIGTIASESLSRQIIDHMKKNEGKTPVIFHAPGLAFGVMTDLLASTFDKDTTVPQTMISAGERLIQSREKEMQQLGLMRSDSPAGGFAFDVGSGIGSVTASVGATVVTRDPKVGAAFFGWLQNTQSYQEARKAGKSPAEATGAAIEVAGAVTALEAIGGHFFLGAAAGSSFVKKTIIRAAGQGAEEATQGAAEEAILNKEGVRTTSLKDAILSVGYQGLIGFVSGAPVSAVVSKMEGTAKKAGISEEKTKEIIDNFVKNKDELVNAGSRLIDNEASKVAVDNSGHKEVLESLSAGEQKQAEVPSVTQVVDKNYLDQATEIKIQLSAETVDMAKPSSLRKAIGYVPESISSFIKRTGGITDAGKELLARGVDHKRLPGLIRKAKAEQSNQELMAGMNRNDVVGVDDVKQRVFDAGYFPEKTDYNQISDSELYDAISSDLTSGERRYKAADAQKIQDYLAKNPNVSDQYAQMGIDASMSAQEIAQILRDNDAVQTKEVAADMNDPRFSGELDLANSSLNVKTIKSKEQIFKEVLAAYKKKGSPTLKGVKHAISDLGGMVNAALTPISTRLRNLNEKLGARLRKFEFDRNQQINADQEAVKPFLEKYSKLSHVDRVILDFAMRNGDKETINQIAEKNGMTADIEAVRKALDGLYKRAQSVGLEIGYRKNFFPRYVSEPKAMLDYFAKTEAWNDIQAAISKKQLELGRDLEDSEKAYLINTLLRGYSVEQITLSRPGALKERLIDVVTPEINNFYGATDQAIMRYVTSVNDAVETRKFFGKDSKVNEFEKIEDSIGFFVLQELQKGNISPTQAQELSKIMKARFARGQMNNFWRGYRNLSYIDTMGSPISAITQLADLGIAFYKNGVYRTLSTLPRAIVGKSKLTAADINVTQIAQEFEGESTSANAVKKIFKVVGLEKMDAIGKEVIINGALKRYRALAKKPTQNFKDQLDIIFGEETDQVIQDLKDGKNSQNVKLLLFNELLDLQPVALSEMPEAYLRSGNGRIFYMLKTYTVKQFDIYRREVFDQIRKDPVQGMKNLTRLVTFFVMMNAGADFLKDLILGRETPVEDQVVNNIARIFGLSKYNVYTARREGIGSAAFKTIAPPFKLIDSSYKDMNKLIENGEIDMDELETLQSVPVAGKMLYWWFGAGADK